MDKEEDYVGGGEQRVNVVVKARIDRAEGSGQRGSVGWGKQSPYTLVSSPG